MDTTEQKTSYSFDEIWDSFSSQLREVTEKHAKKEEEINDQLTYANRVDLTELNTLSVMKHKLEAALEALDLVRVNCLNLEPLIVYEGNENGSSDTEE